MTWIIDASVAIEWIVEGPLVRAAEEIIQSGELLIAPDLILAEVANALRKLDRQGRASPLQMASGLGSVQSGLTYTVALAELAPAALVIARALNHPAYDCFYIALAEREDGRVATMDRRLAGAVAHTRWASRVKLLTGR